MGATDWIAMLENQETVVVGPDSAAQRKQREALLGKMPKDYAAFVKRHGRFTAGGLHVLSAAEMVKETKFVRVPKGTRRGDDLITTDHLVAFAKAGDESAWCFAIGAKGLPVYYCHQDHPPAKRVDDGKWLDKAHATPQFASFSAWLEVAVLDVLHGDGEMVRFDEPYFRWKPGARLTELRKKAKAAKPATKAAFGKPTRLRTLTKDYAKPRRGIDGLKINLYELGSTLLIHHVTYRSSEHELREERVERDSADAVAKLADERVAAGLADGFELFADSSLYGAQYADYAGDELKAANKKVRDGRIKLVRK